MKRKYDTSTLFAWFDLEMTGLDVETCTILEIACVITDSKFNVIDESPSLVIHHPLSILENMNPWCLRVHSQNGLIEKSYNSRVTIEQAEHIMLEFISKRIGPKESPLCGNSVWQDRRFMSKYMPRLESYFKHQLLDLATLRILNCISSRRDDEVDYKPRGQHDALSDIKDHVEEFKFFLDKFDLR